MSPPCRGRLPQVARLPSPLLLMALGHLAAASCLYPGPRLSAAWHVGAVVLLLLVVLYLWLGRRPGAIALMAMLGGLALAVLRQAPAAPPRLPLVAPRPVEFQARLRARHGSGSDSWLLLDHLQQRDGRALCAQETTLLAVPGEPLPALRVGKLVLAQGRLSLDRHGWRLEQCRLQPLRERGPPAPLLRLRQAIRDRLDAVLPPSEAGLAHALLLGERGGLSAQLEEGYRRFGLLHLLAVSGMHLWVWSWLWRRLLPSRGRALRWPILGVLVWLAGAGPAVLRAACVLACRELAHGLGLRLPALRLWTWAWAAACLPLPGSDSLGLLLSFSATLCLILGRASRHAAWWHQALQGSWVAFLGSMPLLHAVQGTIEPWSIPLSPLLALLLPWRLVAILLALLPGGAVLAAPMLHLSVRLEAHCLRLLEALPAAPWVATAISSWGLALLALALLAGTAYWSQAPEPGARPRRGWISCALGVAVAISSLLCWPRQQSTPQLLLLDSGHGLAVLVVGYRHSLLFDCGSATLPPRELIDRDLLPTLAAAGLPPPRRALRSHQDADHVNAFPFLAQRWKLHTLTLPRGSRRPLPGLEPWAVEAIAMEGAHHGVSNDGGIALELQSCGKRVVLLGDQDGYSLRALCKRVAPGPIDLLLLPHHGLSTDGLDELLNHLQPRLCWASCGELDFPLPAAPLLASHGIPLRTTVAGPLRWSPPPSPGQARQRKGDHRERATSSWPWRPPP